MKPAMGTGRRSTILAPLRHVMIALALVIASSVQASEPWKIFRPPPSPETVTDWSAVIDGIVEEETKARLVPLLAAAEVHPGIGTASALLTEFEVFANSERLREAVLRANRNVLLMADLARHELTIQTNIVLNGGGGGRIAAVSRTGSSARRHLQWLRWSGDWNALPDFDEAYYRRELLSSDDDLTNWAPAAAVASDPAAHERVNAPAPAVFGDLARSARDAALDELEPSLRQALSSVSFDGAAERMNVAFLSPTKAWDALPPHAKTLVDAPTELAALVLSDPEKYGGLFFEEHLHAWGLEKGIVTEDVTRPDGPGATVPYRESLSDGVLSTLVRDRIPNARQLDPFGWAANNYRQAFGREGRSPKAIAKYTWRLLAYWHHAGMNLQAALGQTEDAAGFNEPIALDETLALVRTLHKPASADAVDSAVAAAGGLEAIRNRLKRFQIRLGIAAHRQHVEVLARGLLGIAQEQAHEPQQRPLTLDEIRDLARDSGAAGDFVRSLNALATAYAMMPDDVLVALASDLGAHIQRNEGSQDPANALGALQRTALLEALTESIDAARAAGRDLQHQAAAVGRLREFANEALGRAISRHLAEMKEPDLDAYLLDIFAGRQRKRVLTFLWETREIAGRPIRFPAVRKVEAQWTARDVLADMDRVQTIGKVLGWQNVEYAERIRAYFADEPQLALDVMKLINRIYDPTEGRPRYAEYSVGDETRRILIRPNATVDIALDAGRLTLNAGHLAFIGFMKGSEHVKTVWGHWGDVRNVADLARHLHDAWGGGIDDPTALDRIAQAELSAIASVISLADMPERLVKSWNAYGRFVSPAPGSAPVVPENVRAAQLGPAAGAQSHLRRAGNALGLIGSVSNTLGQTVTFARMGEETPEAYAELAIAAAKDLALRSNALAVSFTLYQIFSAGREFVATSGANAEFVRFLVRNGEWTFPDDGRPPVLRGVHAFGGFVPEDADGRAKICRERAADSRAVSAPRPGAGIETILRETRDTALCDRVENGRCLGLGAELAHPRDAMLTLFRSARYHQSEPVMQANVQAVQEFVDWSWLDWIGDRIAGVDPEEWTSDWLKERGIFVPTPETSPDFLRGIVAVDESAGGDAYARAMNAGARKTLGTLVSQYWVRRQFVMECAMLDPLIEAAAREAEKEALKEAEPGAFADAVARIDARIRQLDARVWPLIAASADPYEGDPPLEEKLRIYQDFRERTAPIRRAVRTFERWLQAPDIATVPWEIVPLADALRRHASGLAPGERVAAVEPAIERLADHLLLDLNGVMHAYLATFDGAIADLERRRALVAEAEGFDIAPYHIELFPTRSFAPPPGGWQGPFDDLTGDPPSLDWMGLRRLARDLGSAPSLLAARTAVESWDATYRQATDDNLGALATVMDALNDRLWSIDGGEDSPVVAPLVSAEAKDLALRHPLYRKLFRMKMQEQKASNAADYWLSATSQERAALLARFTYDWPDPGRRAPSSAAGAMTASRLRHAELMALAARMFEPSLAVEPGREIRLTEPLAARAAPRPISGTGVRPDDIDRLGRRFIWEIARIGYPAEWTDPSTRPFPEGVAPVRCAFPGEMPGFPAAEERARDTGRVRETVYAPVESGRYVLRLTVTTEDHVPLAQESVEVVVHPAELAATIEEISRSEEPTTYEIHLYPRGEPRSGRPRAIATSHGSFAFHLCGLPRDEIARSTDGRWQMKDPSDLKQFYEVVAVSRREGWAPKESNASAVAMVDTARFAARDPLVLRFSDDVSIDVTVRDAAEEEVGDALVKLTSDDARRPGPSADDHLVTGPPPFVLQLEDGDVLTATAEVLLEEGIMKGESDPVSHAVPTGSVRGSSSLDLEVVLPFYDLGNLAVTGRFTATGGVGGGVIRAGPVTGQDEDVLLAGDRFELVNVDRQLPLINGIAFQALLHDGSDEKWLLRPGDGTVEAPLSAVAGGRIDLGPVPAVRTGIGPVEVTASVIDASGAAADADVDVALDGRHMTREGDGTFRAEWTVRKWNEEAELTARYPVPGRPAVEARGTVGMADLDDPFAPSAPRDVVLELPVYLPNNLPLRWTGSVAQGAADPPRSADFTVRVGAGEETFREILGRRTAPLPLPVPVAIGETITVAARADNGKVVFRGERRAKAPDGHATGLDIRGIELRPAEGIVPDLTALDENTARRILAEHGLELMAARGDPAEVPAMSGIAYGQIPEPGPASSPETLPIGGKVLVFFFTDAEPEMLTVAVPAVRGWPVEDASARLAEAGFAVETKALGPAPEGEEPGIVSVQSPGPGEEFDPRTTAVTISYYEEPEDDALAGEDRDPFEGPWRGTVALTHLDTSVQGLKATCENAVGCRSEMLRLITSKREQTARHGNAREVFQHVDAQILSLVAAGIEIGFEGVEAGLVLARAEAGSGYTLSMAGMPEEQAAAGEAFLPVLEPTGHASVTEIAGRTVQRPGDVRTEIDVSAALDDRAETLRVRISVRIALPEGRIIVESGGTLERGTIDFAEVQASAAARVRARMQEYARVLARYGLDILPDR